MKRARRQEPMRCRCEPGADAAQQHGKPGAKAADHGNPFTLTGNCIHSDLQHTTRPLARRTTVKRLRLR